MRRHLSALLLVISVSAAHADKADLVARLERAAAQTSLYQPTLKPWHLKVAFTLYDDSGKNPVAGVMEEWWADEAHDRSTFTSPASSDTLLRLVGSSYFTPGSTWPQFLVVLHYAIVDPLPAGMLPTHGEVPGINKVKFGKANLDCITVYPAGVRLTAPTDRLSNYCFDQNAGDLRLISQFGGQSVLRNTMGKFQGKSIPIDSIVMANRTTVADGKVVTLETMAASAMNFSPAGLELYRPRHAHP